MRRSISSESQARYDRQVSRWHFGLVTYFLFRDRKNWRTLVEVLSFISKSIKLLIAHIDGVWHDFVSDDQFVRGEFATLADGQEVTIAANQRLMTQSVNKTASSSPSG
jgi:hypothetical protein